MARHSLNSLGRVSTPHGPVHFRIERTSYKDHRRLAAHGPTLALRWLFPTKVVPHDQIRIRVSPDSPLLDDEAVTAFFTELTDAWAYRERAANLSTANTPEIIPAVINQGVTLNHLIADADGEAAATVRPSTLSAYRFEWKALCRLLPGSTPVSSVTRPLALDALKRDRDAGIAPETHRKHAVALKLRLG